MTDATAASHDSSLQSKRKRPTDDSSNDDELRFNKRFHLLSLGNAAPGIRSHESGVTSSTADTRPQGNSNYYIPVTTPTSNGAPLSPHTTVEDDSMNVDETRDRVYVQNLDAELAEIEANEPDERLIFLPDIEKHFSRIPEHLLAAPSSAAAAAQQRQELVLYSVPKSLTVDESQDSVRKAILEARQRARDKAAEEARHEEMERQYANTDEDGVETAHGYVSGYDAPVEDDPDAMDIE